MDSVAVKVGEFHGIPWLRRRLLLRVENGVAVFQWPLGLVEGRMPIAAFAAWAMGQDGDQPREEATGKFIEVEVDNG